MYIYGGGSQVCGKEKRKMIDKELLEILACPLCKKDVVAEGDKIVCKSCGRKYPVKDGIPIMLIETTEPGAKDT